MGSVIAVFLSKIKNNFLVYLIVAPIVFLLALIIGSLFFLALYFIGVSISFSFWGLFASGLILILLFMLLDWGV